MSTSSKFYSLSEELLTAITEQLTQGTDHDWLVRNVFPCLKALRLSSPRFAYLNGLRKVLFGGIQLVAAPERLQYLVEADISRIVPFVKTVIFVAPPNGWTLTFEGFKEVVIAQAIQKHASDHQIPDKYDFYTFQPDGYHAFVEDYWNTKFPLSDTQIRVGFEKHRDDALAVKNLLLGNELRVAWTNALRTLQNLHSVRFASVQYDESSSSHLPVQPDCIVRAHHHDLNYHLLETCRRIAAPVGDRLFAAGIACLAEANIKVQTLDVACAMTGQFDWEALSGWERLDLSQMQTFTFQPQVETRNDENDAFGSDDAIAKRATIATAAVMKKCKNSLREFNYKSSCPMQWPGHEVILLPNLRDLSLGRGCIRPPHLRNWMAKMPSLNRFHLDGSRSSELPSAWLDVFDAIRDHPREINVQFDQIIINDIDEISLQYHTDDFERVLEEPEDEDPLRDINRILALYLSGKSNINRPLKWWLQV